MRQFSALGDSPGDELADGIIHPVFALQERESRRDVAVCGRLFDQCSPDLLRPGLCLVEKSLRTDDVHAHCETHPGDRVRPGLSAVGQTEVCQVVRQRLLCGLVRVLLQVGSDGMTRPAFGVSEVEHALSRLLREDRLPDLLVEVKRIGEVEHELRRHPDL